MEYRLKLERWHDGKNVETSVFKAGQLVDRRVFSAAYECVAKLIEDYGFNEILDIGSGKQNQAAIFRAAGKNVVTVDPVHPADFQADYATTQFHRTFPAIFCSHVLEHQRNVGLFLDKIFDDLSDWGVLGITVPPVVNHYVAQGHCNWFNAGSLLYHLVLAGFDCSEACCLVYGYNLSVIVRKSYNGLPRRSVALDLREIRGFFPRAMRAPEDTKPMTGSVLSINWTPKLAAQPHPAAT